MGVTATGKKNQAVQDLTKQEFSLEDNAIAQTIARISVWPRRDETSNIPLPPGVRVFQNRPAFPAGTLSVVLLDDLNTDPPDRANARQQLVKSLSHLPAERPLVLYELGTELLLLRDFADASAAPGTLPKGSENPGGNSVVGLDSAPGNTDGPRLEEILNRAYRKVSDYRTLNRAETTPKAFEAIARRMRDVPGSKNLVWISGGFPFSIGVGNPIDLKHSYDERNFSRETETVARTLGDAQIAVFPVDARGARTAEETSFDRHISAQAIPKKGGLTRDPAYDEMTYLADLTGGRSFHNSNNLSKSIVSAIEEAVPTYSLSFYPNTAWDGKYHKLNLTVGRPGVKLRYRMGYFASKPADSLAAPVSLDEAVESTQEFTAIGISVSVAAKDGGYKMTIAVDPRELSLTKTGEDWIGALELLVLSCRTEDRSQSGKVTKLRIRLTEAKYTDALSQGLRFITLVEPPRDANQIRIGLRDEISGSIGTLFLRLR